MSEFLNEYLMKILVALAIAIAGITTKFVITLIQRGVTFINEKIDTIKDENLKNYCREMMEAAETMTKELLTGAEKKQWVIERLIEYAEKKNISVTDEQLSNLVQAIFQQLDGVTLNTYKTESIDINDIISEAINKTLNVATESIIKEINSKKE